MRVKADYHASAVLAIEEHDGLPVLVHQGGRYPGLTDDAGASVAQYIQVAQFGDGFSVVGRAGPGYGGRSMDLHVGTAPTLDEARALYPAAKQAIEQAPELFARAQALAGKLAYQGPLTRAEYEALAAEWGVPVRPDAELSGWGDFGFPQYGLDVLPGLWINQRRGWGVEREAEAARQLASAAAATARQAAIAAARTGPVVRTVVRFVRAGLPSEFVDEGYLYTVTGRGKCRHISEDDPALFGSHLLGHEGEAGETVTLEVRGPLREGREKSA